MNGLGSAWNDLTHNVGNGIDNIFNDLTSTVGGWANAAGDWISSLWDGGFAGVSDFEALKAAVTSYIDGVNEVINEFNADANLDTTIRGQAGTALSDYVATTKAALQKYVSVLSIWKTDLDTVLEGYQAGDTNIQNAVENSTQDLQQNVNRIDTDSTGIGGTGSAGSGIDIG